MHFLDSGFFPHPDYADRVIAFKDISGEEKSFGEKAEPQGFHWHGTQTVVSCAGNGKLSDGVYSGLASNSRTCFGESFRKWRKYSGRKY